MEKKTQAIITFAMLTLLAGCATSKNSKVKKESLKYTQAVKAVSLGQISQKVKCPTSIKQVKDKVWQVRVAAINSCIKNNRWARSEQLANDLAKNEHLAPWGAYYLSIIAERRADYPRALWMVDLAMKKSSESGLLLYQKGRILWALKEYTEATQTIQKAVDLNSELLEGHLFLGQIYLRDLQYDEAEESFESVLKMDANNSTALLGIAETKIQSDEGLQAMVYLDKVLGKEPYNLNARLRHAFVFEQLIKDYNKALQSYRKLKQLVDLRKVARPTTVDLDKKIRTLESNIKQQGEKVSMNTKKGVEK